MAEIRITARADIPGDNVMLRALQKTKAKGTDLAILLALASLSDDGIVCVAHSGVAAIAQVTKRAAQQSMANLIESGDIEVATAGIGRTVNCYRILAGADPVAEGSKA